MITVGGDEMSFLKKHPILCLFLINVVVVILAVFFYKPLLEDAILFNGEVYIPNNAVTYAQVLLIGLFGMLLPLIANVVFTIVLFKKPHIFWRTVIGLALAVVTYFIALISACVVYGLFDATI